VASSRYSYNIDLDNLNTSHSLAVLSVKPGDRVLDIGAADGSVAKVLVERGCRVWAVEMDERAAGEAAFVCERVVIHDAETLDFRDAFDGNQFDVVLLLDVLEHLQNPLAVLKNAAGLLLPGGRIVASIPNVTHGAVRLNLLRGRFTYTETGLLDRSHLRFFDREAVDCLFNDANLDICERLRVTRNLADTEIPIDLRAFSRDVIDQIERDPEARTFQFVIVATPRGAKTSAQHPPRGSLTERLLENVHELEERLRAAEVAVRIAESARPAESEHHVESLTQQRDELRKTLGERMDELHARDKELKFLRADLAVKEAFVSELREALRKHEDVAHEAQKSAATIVEAAAAAELERRMAAEQYARYHQEIAEALQRAQTTLSAPSVRAVVRISQQLRRAPRIRGFLRTVFRSMFLPDR